jgi:hypothetical protein
MAEQSRPELELESVSRRQERSREYENEIRDVVSRSMTFMSSTARA